MTESSTLYFALQKAVIRLPQDQSLQIVLSIGESVITLHPGNPRRGGNYNIPYKTSQEISQVNGHYRRVNIQFNILDGNSAVVASGSIALSPRDFAGKEEIDFMQYEIPFTDYQLERPATIVAGLAMTSLGSPPPQNYDSLTNAAEVISTATRDQSSESGPRRRRSEQPPPPPPEPEQQEEAEYLESESGRRHRRKKGTKVEADGTFYDEQGRKHRRRRHTADPSTVVAQEPENTSSMLENSPSHPQIEEQPQPQGGNQIEEEAEYLESESGRRHRRKKGTKVEADGTFYDEQGRKHRRRRHTHQVDASLIGSPSTENSQPEQQQQQQETPPPPPPPEPEPEAPPPPPPEPEQEAPPPQPQSPASPAFSKEPEAPEEDAPPADEIASSPPKDSSNTDNTSPSRLLGSPLKAKKPRIVKSDDDEGNEEISQSINNLSYAITQQSIVFSTLLKKFSQNKSEESSPFSQSMTSTQQSSQFNIDQNSNQFSQSQTSINTNSLMNSQNGSHPPFSSTSPPHSSSPQSPMMTPPQNINSMSPSQLLLSPNDKAIQTGNQIQDPNQMPTSPQIQNQTTNAYQFQNSGSNQYPGAPSNSFQNSGPNQYPGSPSSPFQNSGPNQTGPAFYPNQAPPSYQHFNSTNSQKQDIFQNRAGGSTTLSMETTHFERNGPYRGFHYVTAAVHEPYEPMAYSEDGLTYSHSILNDCFFHPYSPEYICISETFYFEAGAPPLKIEEESLYVNVKRNTKPVMTLNSGDGGYPQFDCLFNPYIVQNLNDSNCQQPLREIQPNNYGFRQYRPPPRYEPPPYRPPNYQLPSYEPPPQYQQPPRFEPHLFTQQHVITNEELEILPNIEQQEQFGYQKFLSDSLNNNDQLQIDSNTFQHEQATSSQQESDQYKDDSEHDPKKLNEVASHNDGSDVTSSIQEPSTEINTNIENQSSIPNTQLAYLDEDPVMGSITTTLSSNKTSEPLLITNSEEASPVFNKYQINNIIQNTPSDDDDEDIAKFIQQDNENGPSQPLPDLRVHKDRNTQT